MMERSFSEALKQRRTYYSITNQSPISDQEIECIVNMTVRHVPSAFNSQTTRVVLLLGESHKKLWQIVKDALKKIVPAEAFAKTEEKIDHSFACGYGTVLFFEDQKVVKGLQEAFPSYQENFPRSIAIETVNNRTDPLLTFPRFFQVIIKIRYMMARFISMPIGSDTALNIMCSR